MKMITETLLNIKNIFGFLFLVLVLEKGFQNCNEEIIGSLSFGKGKY